MRAFWKWRAASLRRQVLMAQVVVVLGLTTSAGFATYWFVRQVEATFWRERQTEAARQAGIIIGNFINHTEDALFTAGILGHDEFETEPGRLMQFLQDTPWVMEMVIVGADGQVEAGRAQDRDILSDPFTVLQSAWFRQARSGQRYRGPVQVSANNEPYMILALPLALAGGDDDLLATRIKMTLLWDEVSRIQIGQEGHTYVVNADGYLIAHTHPEVVLAYTNVGQRPELAAAQQTSEAVWHGEYRNFANESVTGAIIRLPDIGWFIVVESPESEVYAGSRLAAVFLIGSITLASMLGLGANVWQLQTTFVNPLTQVRDGTRRFGAGDLTYRLNFSRADEIGQLARTFDEMAGQLQAQQQALQDLNASLEIRVVNRTEELQMERDHAQAMSARHQALLDAIPDLIFRISNTGVYLDYKANLKDDLLAPAETFLGKTLAETLPPDIAQQSHTALQEALASDTIQAFEYQLALPAGPQIFEARLARSGPQEVTAIVRNITERKQAEAQLQASLQEKEVLLKEVHHRVKNNLQVISSLLQLQSRKITDPQLLELFRESQNRVAAMALIHEQLYQASNFAGVDFGAYAHTLGLSLIDSYGISRSHITLTVEAAKLALDINQAIPCGLILNEALSNSLKYAFPNGQRGHITIALSETSAAYRLKISDDGIGLPPSPSTYRPGSLGLRLINRLVSQLGGTLEHLGPPGTIYQIQFPNPRMD